MQWQFVARTLKQIYYEIYLYNCVFFNYLFYNTLGDNTLLQYILYKK